jgi:hypothetical protein
MTYNYVVYYRKVGTNIVDTWEGIRSPALPIWKIRLTDRHVFCTAAYTKHDVPQHGISDTILKVFERRQLLKQSVQNGRYDYVSRLSNCTQHTDVWLATRSEHSTETPQFTVILPTKLLSSQKPAVRSRNLNPVQFSSTWLPSIILFPAHRFPGYNPAPRTDYSETYRCYSQSPWKNVKIISRITPRPLPYQFSIRTTLPYHTT